jgi:hypothetical protein
MNYNCWLPDIKRQGREPDDILLVTGWTKVKSWEASVTWQIQNAYGVGVQAGQSSIGEVGLSAEVQREYPGFQGREVNDGPPQ